MTRRQELGNFGERTASSLLKEAGFDSVQDLNSVRLNHPGGDYLAKKDGDLYFLTVKARKKIPESGKPNTDYNIYPDKVRAAAREYGAIPAWLVIQVDIELGCFSAYWGTVDSLPNPTRVAVRMTPEALATYHCLAKDYFDAKIMSEFSNEVEEATGTAIADGCNQATPTIPAIASGVRRRQAPQKGIQQAILNALTKQPQTMRQLMAATSAIQTHYNHLNRLAAKGLVRKIGNGYSLLA